MKKEPIAIIGIGCRFPGSASSPAAFWNLLCEGKDAIVEVPHDRWDLRRFYHSNVNMPSKMNVKRGGFLNEKWSEFDAEFFQISPREANFLDPQQRLLLELAWEAMEDGGLLPDALKGLNGGVFIGAFTTDWQTLQNSPYNTHHCEMYSGINGSKTILSARLSHFFDLKGPCLSVDTACSSSLVAVHLACQSLWQGESSFAIAGGVNAILVPETTMAMSKGRFLNPNGQCRSFDADAKGYVRGEGGGIVILKTLSEAMRDGDSIYALLRGTGVNQDGYTAGGITQPNAQSQWELIEKVLRDCHVSPSAIQYVEAHGTGTPSGDPTEALAISKVINNHRSAPCYLGSVKSNIGHLEAAAGIAGLIKATLCLKNKQIPKNLHFDNPNPNIPFEKYGLKVPTTLVDLPYHPISSFALVNAFGYGGTNANVLLETYEDRSTPTSEQSLGPVIFPFSAKSPEGLKETAKNFETFVNKNPSIALSDLAYTLACKRSSFDYRMTVSAQSVDELQNKLHLLAKDEVPEGCVKGKVNASQSPLAFIYTGMGPQWWGMGRGLLNNSPIFLKTIQQCDEVLSTLTDWSLLVELQKSESDSRMEDPEISQVANYSIQAGLTNMLKTYGVQPDYIVGHSIGEVAAAYACGVLTLEEGVKVSFHRSRIQSKRKNVGTMLATGLSAKSAQEMVERYPDISIAAENSFHSVTLSGNKKSLEAVADHLDKSEIFHKFLKVNIAYHSSQMDGLESDLIQALSFLEPKKPSIPFFSTAFGAEYNDCLDASYWWHNIRNPVHFAPIMQKAIANGCKLFLEIGPHPVLSAYIKEAFQHAQVTGTNLATLNRKKNDAVSFQECLGGLYVSGYHLAWDKINPVGGKFIRLPTYPWNKKSYWIESTASRHYRLGSRDYPMLSQKLKTSLPTWQIEVNHHYFPWLEDHKVQKTIIFPAAGYIEAGIEIYVATQGNGQFCLEDVVFHLPLTLQENVESLLQISFDPESHHFKVHSLSEDKEWLCHASGKCKSANYKASTIQLDALKTGELIESEKIYRLFAEKGLEYGPHFRGISRVWKNNGQALSEIHANLEGPYILSPPILDAAFQTLIGTIDQTSDDGIILPSKVGQIIYFQQPGSVLYCRAICTKQTSQLVEGNLEICDAEGNLCVQIKALQCRVIALNTEHEAEKILYFPTWLEKPLVTMEVVNGPWLICSDYHSLNDNLKGDLTSQGIACSILSQDLLDSEEDIEKILDSLSPESNLNIVFGSISEIPLENSANHEITTLCRCTNLIKAIERVRPNQQTNLRMVTRGTQAVHGAVASVTGASLWGLGRVIRHESTNIHCSLIDWEADQDLSSLMQELLTGNEFEVAFRNGLRYVYKLKKKDAALESKHKIPLTNFSLELKTPGLMNSLYFKEIAINDPQPNEVTIQVHTASLNFKDLMKILGMLNETALQGTYFGTNFGMECAGTIVAVGVKVKKYKVGDQVCAFIPNSFQSYVTLSERLITPIPPGCALDDAAVYIPFITVLHALKDVAKLRRGETILIHSATGAVGLTAIQYARHVGARIIATAGNEEKRAYLRDLGIQDCSDSHSLAFVDDIWRWTNGRGVDVVLNSLGGEALTKSFSLLASQGRFIEIGKKDISINSPLPMKDFDRNTLFASIDMDRIFREQPKLIQRLLKEAFSLFEKNVLQPLPCTIFPASESVEAFQYMARAKHMGKIMLKFANETVSGIPLNRQKVVDPNASYLITGGVSGFGLLTAKWLVEKGAKYLILVGRSGAATLEAQNAVKWIEQQGVTVKVASADVANYAELSHVFKQLCKTLPPIKGIIHSAMVLKDAFLTQQTAETISQAMAPKIGGCIHLHQLTADLQLDFFVMFSSISSIIGNPGQGNYAAGNAFLDSFCHYRHSLGLPATTINWGALNTGVLARDSKISDHLAHHGILALAPKIALKVLEKSILEGYQQICGMDLDWKKLMESLPEIRASFAFSDFKLDLQGNAASSFASQIQAMSKEESLELIKQKIGELVGKTLKMEPSKIDISMRLNKLGVDSLMTIELLASIENELGIKVPTMELMKGPTIEQLAQVIFRLLLGSISTNRAEEMGS